MITFDQLEKFDAKEKDDAKSDARAGYDIVLKLTDSVSRTIWSQYVALLATNAFLVSVGGFLYQNQMLKGVVKIGLPLFGVVFCVCWILLTLRSYDFYKYYFACARELESLAFGDIVHTVRNGRSFAEGKLVDIRVVTRATDSQATKQSNFLCKLRRHHSLVRAENVT